MERIRLFNKGGLASMVIDGQFGSTGKGLIAAFLARHSPPTICTTNAAPNAGHTTILEDGTKFVCFHIPTAAVINPDAMIYLNSGAAINPEIFFEEIERLNISRDRIIIHPNAAVIYPVEIGRAHV